MTNPPSTTHTPRLDAFVDAIRRTPTAAVMFDLETRRMVEISQLAEAMLQRTRDELIGRLVTEVSGNPAVATASIDLIADGTVDGFHSRRTARRPDGSIFDGKSTVRRVEGDHGHDLIVAVFDDNPPSPNPVVTSVTGPVVIGTFGDDFRLRHVSGGVKELLGTRARFAIGSSVFDGIHRDDHADVLVGVGQVLSGVSSVTVRIRVRHVDGSWHRARTTITLLDPGTPRVLAYAMEPAIEIDDDTRSDLVERMRRIAAELQAAGITDALDGASGLKALKGVDDLSERQREILVRILDGERVPTIARELFVSQSTVRNQLAAIYRKVGVHSQGELVEKLRSG